MRLTPAAINFAARTHRHQVRKDGVTPYVAHVTRVTLVIAAEFGVTDDEVLAAAALHDTIEDCNVDYDEIAEAFGPTIADWVARLTKDTRLPNTERESAYLATIAAGPWQVQLIKLADTLDNLRDSNALTAKQSEKTRAKANEVLSAIGPAADAPLMLAMETVRGAIDETRQA